MKRGWRVAGRKVQARGWRVALFAACLTGLDARGQATGASGSLVPATNNKVLFSFDSLKDLEATATNMPVMASLGPAAGSGGVVQCATLIYAGSKQSRCFADRFLKELAGQTTVRTQPTFIHVRADAGDLFRYPFTVMSGEEAFQLTEAERENLRHYFENGGFLIASAGCSSKPWADSFRREVAALFPGRELVKLGPEHPVFHTVYDVEKSHYKVGQDRFPDLYGIAVDGRLAMIFSPDGLNDTGNAGKNCCCCGGNEVKAAMEINVNVLAYALTH
jgi:hypothetical protein